MRSCSPIVNGWKNDIIKTIIGQICAWQIFIDLHSMEQTWSERLEGANLQDANLYQSSLAHACLSGADLTSAGLEDSNLSGADMRQTHYHGRSVSGNWP